MYNLLKTFVFVGVICFSSSFSVAMELSREADSQNEALLLQYSDVVGVPKEVFVKPSLESLKTIVNQHVMSIPYNNFDIFFNQTAPDLSLSSLSEQLLVKKKGGTCYETSELLLNVLSVAGYNVSRIPAFPFDKTDIPPSHTILLVHIDGNYLVDVGYGINSIRYPVKFSFEQDEEVEVFSNEQYKLICDEDYYRLRLKIDGKWSPLYSFSKSLKPITLEQIAHIFERISDYSVVLPIRDVYVKSSILTRTGRVGFYIEPKKGISSAYRVIDNFNEKKFYNQPAEFVQDILHYIGLEIPRELCLQ